MNFKKLFSFFCIGLLLAILSTSSYAQQFDYEKYPRLNFSFNQLDLNLTVNPDDRSIKGTAAYSMQANIGGLDSLVLQAAHMEIASVTVNDESAEYNLHNDSLFIYLPDSSKAGEQFDISVDYSTIPKFGVLKDEKGTLWTSLLPRSHHHWFPGTDHPRVTFNSSITLQVPSGYQAVANGVRLREQEVDDGQVQFIYKTRNPVPATSLAFAVGQFDSDETSFGVKKIGLSTEKGLMSGAERSELLNEASRIVENIEQELGREFPFERLNLLVLQDHHWETKSWGASTVFIYRNRGSMIHQLRRGIAAQWFGVFQREEQWSDAKAINLLQRALQFQLGEEDDKLELHDQPEPSSAAVYDVFGPGAWNKLQYQFDNLEAVFKKTVSETLSGVLNLGEGVYSFRDYGEFWYGQNGQPAFELKFVSQQKTDSTGADSVIYRIDYEKNKTNLELVFTAQKGFYDELVTLPLVQVTPSGVDTLEVTFTGARDSVNIQVPALTRNVTVLAYGVSNLTLEQYKPASFLIYQMRNANTVEERVEAAKKLSHHSDDPDLQFAIKEFMSQELQPIVRAALLRSYGEITDGASGTEQVFLDALQNENKEIQQAGLSALQNYSGNRMISETVRQYALGSDSLPVFKNATQVLSVVADSSAFEDFVSDIVRTDTAGHKAIFAIQELANNGNVGKALRQAEFYVLDVYEYPVRSSALNILLQHDNSAASWEGRIEGLLADVDPRIRYVTVRGLPKIEGLAYGDMLNTLIQDEYDQRVYQAMRGVISEE